MRRAAFAVLGTAIGTALLIGAKLGTPTPGSGTQVALEEPADAATPTAGAKAPTGKKTTAPPKKDVAAKPPASGLRDGTFAGAGAKYDYGTIKVTITVKGGKVSDVDATYPDEDPTSAGVNENAIPKLRQQVLAAQSAAKITTVSGASLTSAAYKASLQSALDKAKA
ncbi:FMN-binding protein [Plantactinospora sp. S1510]|uniref:FMN-binding protein n=1 Tax=Plantactinospora alkalitolerans TaxID=2789879 RepID=A0ABS0GVW1_9ACTN|nr:FMN-binding protein [Plantactinospora alkalitolerans]MBF9130214.1 FMN-binding protein [Plantactinospora alkalitolerans]